jgi:hypothetical protein
LFDASVFQSPALYCSIGSASTKIAEDRRRSIWFRDKTNVYDHPSVKTDP